jgi:predicted esterase
MVNQQLCSRLFDLTHATLWLLVLYALVDQPRALAKPKNHSHTVGQLIRVEANDSEGFQYPFFLYIPVKSNRLLVVPNNTGTSDNDLGSHIQAAKRQALGWGDLAESVAATLLVPCFPRPRQDPPVYTHALARAALSTIDPKLARLDLQLIKMIEAARKVLPRYRVRIGQKVLMFGFSASAMFVNRFTFIHPRLVAAAAFGSPGGWPLAPQPEFAGNRLTYPIGTADLQDLTGRKLDLDALKRVPIFAFIGGKDQNDSVIFRDGYTESDQRLIFELFGRSPIDRWPVAERLYKDAGLSSRFRVYPELGHETNRPVQRDVADFLNSVRVE